MNQPAKMARARANKNEMTVAAISPPVGLALVLSRDLRSPKNEAKSRTTKKVIPAIIVARTYGKNFPPQNVTRPPKRMRRTPRIQGYLEKNCTIEVASKTGQPAL